MKSFIALVVILAALSAPNSKADLTPTAYGMCESYGEFATAIVNARGRGAGMDEVLKLARDTKDTLNPGRPERVVRAAYALPEADRYAAEVFGKKTAKECITDNM